MANLGPATTANANSVAVLTPLNQSIGAVSNLPQGTNALRCLAVARSISIAAGTGDIAVVPLINCTSFLPTAIVFANAYQLVNGVVTSASAAALTVSVNGGPAVTGTSLVASAALANLTGNTKYVSSTIAVAANTLVLSSTMGAAGAASNYIYVNSTVISAAATFCDFFLFGYDLS